YGSEHREHAGNVLPDFLSCLYGSELQDKPTCGRVIFLSCLYGSELNEQHPTILLSLKLINTSSLPP
ncbi:hypothetical protein, partial [Klebsiella sp. ME-303]|uniref:hypothetical protein n=1 Tax=Klebsiella sp. ME-303 TaxID=2600607 RepID=UPI001C93F48A